MPCIHGAVEALAGLCALAFIPYIPSPATLHPEESSMGMIKLSGLAYFNWAWLRQYQDKHLTLHCLERGYCP